MAPITGALYPAVDQLTGHSLWVGRQAQEAHQVDETGGEVHFAAELAGRIVVGKCVVVIVEPLA